MNNPILIVCGEPNSVFSELIIKTFRKYKNEKPLVLIGSTKLIESQIKKLKLKCKLNLTYFINKKFVNLKKNKLNIIDINYNFTKPFEKISSKSNKYIKESFDKALHIIKNNHTSGLINGPISKKYFLKGKYNGITEYLSSKFNLKENYAMLIYNKSLSVSPITTHLPINRISKKLNKSMIISKVTLISKFYKKILSKKPKLIITGLNPHCENFYGFSEEKKIIKPAISILKRKKIDISGPIPADTAFFQQNSKKYDVIIGMYHDQVLAPIKAIKGLDAINITLGLPFIRITPDHGPNIKMVGKNNSDPKSLIEAVKFLDKI